MANRADKGIKAQGYPQSYRPWPANGNAIFSATFLRPNQEDTTHIEEYRRQEQAVANVRHTEFMIARLTQHQTLPAGRKRSQSPLFDPIRVLASLRDADGSFKTLVVDALAIQSEQEATDYMRVGSYCEAIQ
ncbi:14198_t:CDS:2, partial [Acaulospora colombiana]